MSITLNPFISQVFPTFKKNDEENVWGGGIDLNNNGIIESDEEIKDTNDAYKESVEIDDADIIEFFKENIERIPRDKLEEITSLLFDYIEKNPMGGLYYEGEESAYVKTLLSIIISPNPNYLPQVENLLSSNNFLVRWSAVSILRELDIQDNTIRERVRDDLTNLYQTEQNKKIINEKPNILTPYYPEDELYNRYYLSALTCVLKKYE